MRKDHEAKLTRIQEVFKTLSLALTFVMALVGAFVSVVNFFAVRQLSPVYTRLETVEAKDSQIAAELQKHEDASKSLQQNLATKEQVDELKVDLKSVKEQVQWIYQHNFK